MRPVIVSIVLLLFTLYVGSVPAYWGVYYLFADRIASAYCVNPGNPACHGRCHVADVTAKQERQDAPAGGASSGAPSGEIRPEKLPTFLHAIVRHVQQSARSEAFGAAPESGTIAGFTRPIDHPPPVSI